MDFIFSFYWRRILFHSSELDRMVVPAVVHDFRSDVSWTGRIRDFWNNGSLEGGEVIDQQKR